MKRELIEFSDLIDEKFEPATASHTFELWTIILSWFS